MAPADPVVSVLLPVRDEARYLAEALASLTAQTFADFEVVVVDDGSVDDSSAIAEEHSRRDPRFRVLRQPASGLVAALERARSEARGLTLARMDGDDVAAPGAAREPAGRARGRGARRVRRWHRVLPEGRDRGREPPLRGVDQRAGHAREEVVVWGAGPVGKAFARELGRQGTAVAGFVDVDPWKVGHRVLGVPVVDVDDAPRFARAFAVGAVAGAEARERIRETVAAQGRRDGVDFVAVA